MVLKDNSLAVGFFKNLVALMCMAFEMSHFANRSEFLALLLLMTIRTLNYFSSTAYLKL